MGPVDNTDDDDISITSTILSEPQEAYEVVGVLAQKTDHEGEKFLVEWAGYPMERWSWEAEDAFDDPQTLEEWNKRKEAIAQKEQSPFDLSTFDAHIEATREAKVQRQKRRRAKRIRLGIPTDPPKSRGDYIKAYDCGLSDYANSDSNSIESSDRPLVSTLDVPIKREPESDEPEPEPGTFMHSHNHNIAASVASNSKQSGSGPCKATVPILTTRAKHDHPSKSLDKQNPQSLPNNSQKLTTTPFSFSLPPANKAGGNPRKTSTQAGDHDKPKHPSLSLKSVLEPGPSGSHSSTGVGKAHRSTLKPGVPSNTMQSSHPPAKAARSLASSIRVRQKLINQSQSEISPKTPVETFRNLSTRRKYQNAARRERTPDLAQLDVRTPGEWLKPTSKSTPQEGPSRKQREQSVDSLFVEQDSPVSDASENSPRISKRTSDLWAPKSPISTTSYRQPDREQTLDQSMHHSRRGMLEQQPVPENSLIQEVKRKKFFDLDPGELFVHLQFGAVDKDIGDVRLAGLNLKTRRLLLNLKSNNEIFVDFREVCNVEEYRELCKKIFNKAFGHGWVVGYNDNASDVNNMANYLRRHNLAALWHYPSDKDPSTIVAYASGPGPWCFLDGDYSYPSSSNLRIAVRSSLTSASHPYLPAPLYPMKTNLPPPSHSIEAPVAGKSPTDLPPPLDVSPNRESLPIVPAEVNINTYFREHYGISFEQISLVNNSAKASISHAFYLHFPDEVENEYQLVRRFITKHTKAIFSNRLKDDWDRFTSIAAGTSGSILLHQKYIFYDEIPKLYRLLRAPINVFNISLATPIEWADHECHLQRLFPHGGVILITEDFILNETKAALRVIEWFAFFIQTKFPGTWKMFFRPNFLQWIGNLWPEWADETMYHIYCWVTTLIPDHPCEYDTWYQKRDAPESLDGETDDEGQYHPFISTSCLPDYGSRKEDSHQNIPKGLTQKERDTDHLVEYFAGWSINHCDKFRRFVALTHFKPQPRWRRWTHLEAMNYDDFYAKLMKSNLKGSGWKKWSSRPPAPAQTSQESIKNTKNDEGGRGGCDGDGDIKMGN